MGRGALWSDRWRTAGDIGVYNSEFNSIGRNSFEMSPYSLLGPPLDDLFRPIDRLS